MSWSYLGFNLQIYIEKKNEWKSMFFEITLFLDTFMCNIDMSQEELYFFRYLSISNTDMKRRKEKKNQTCHIYIESHGIEIVLLEM